jgi:hypothetical protein
LISSLLALFLALLLVDVFLFLAVHVYILLTSMLIVVRRRGSRWATVRHSSTAPATPTPGGEGRRRALLALLGGGVLVGEHGMALALLLEAGDEVPERG